ncbi:MAG: hypothetical protein HY828_00370 [Actinobacteria bacterium]|nr:hypothetical protein [Actinomycetota bacterium]
MSVRLRHPASPWLIAAMAILVIVMILPSGADAVPVEGSQGVDTALPATPSQVTVSGRGGFAGLSITVNQTAQLTNQAVSITWTGGTPTRAAPSRFGAEYLQIMQCWGDDDGTVPGNPGPPPEQCVQGAVAGTYGGLPAGLYPGGFALSRVISRSDWANFDPNVGVLDARTTNVWRAFRAVDGTEVPIQTDPNFNPSVVGGNYWLNSYFNIITTNEIAGASTGADGKGAELFQVQTGVQSSGLGCGQTVQPLPDGSRKVPQCWIVIVPRGLPTVENAGTPFEANADQSGVATSPLAPAAWQHRIAIPIDFNPVDSPCSLASEERRLSGAELALPAVASWQPALCAGGDLPPYSYAPVSDAAARQQLASSSPGAPGMVVVSRPLDPQTVNPQSPVVYAPVSVSGLVIGFNIERNPKPDAPAAEQQIAGVRVAELNLTPRLVAKLLSQSYRGQVAIRVAPDYPWLATNPAHMGLDPDFLRFNPEFDLLQLADTRTFGGLQLPAGNSDAAQQLWEWVLADPEASAWLKGNPDEWGMTVNPAYAADASLNPNGAAFGDPIPNSFPKSEPYCFQAPARGANNSIVPPPLCGTDWMPYNRGFADGAQITRSAADGARINENTFAQTSAEVWTRELPQVLGRRAMLTLTDTPSAAQFGLQTARLSRAGDNGATRTFIAPDSVGLAAGVASMKPRAVETVLEPAPTADAPGAYPLTAITYAAIAPLDIDATARSEYAAFLEYAAGPGQVAGLALGQLPRGYVSLPDALAAQTAAAAASVRTMVAPADPAATTTTTTTTAAATPQPVVPVVTTRRTTRSSSTGTTTAAPPVTEAPTTTVATEDTSDTTPEEEAPSTPATTPPIITPVLDLAKSRYTLPGLGVVALGSALGVLEITKRPRRGMPTGPDLVDDAAAGAL